MTQHYEPAFKEKIVHLHLEEGHTIKAIMEEYKVSKASISNWVKQFRNQCQPSQETKGIYDYMKENLKLKKELEAMKKETLFLKKVAAFFAKKID